MKPFDIGAGRTVRLNALIPGIVQTPFAVTRPGWGRTYLFFYPDAPEIAFLVSGTDTATVSVTVKDLVDDDGEPRGDCVGPAAIPVRLSREAMTEWEWLPFDPDDPEATAPPRPADP